MSRRRIVAAIAAVVLVVAAGAAYLVFRSIPEVRTAFLIDTSESEDFAGIAHAVGGAALNSGDGDALALRRFGGACADPGNTAELVGPDREHPERIGAAARAVKPSGKATLRDGILASIGDFSGRYPFRGSTLNRIIVVTSHGADACGTAQADLEREVEERSGKAGVRLDFRIVGYKVAEKEQEPLTRLATAVKAPPARFVTKPEGLDALLKELTVPRTPEVKGIGAPTTPPTSAPPTPTPTGPLPDGVQAAFIRDYRDFDVRNRTIAVDPYDLLRGAEAEEAAKADGSTADNDYYQRDPSKEKVRLRVAPDAELRINQLDIEHSGDPSYSRTVTLPVLAKLYEQYQRLQGGELRGFSFEITVTGGEITRIKQHWFP
ncbi:hypothetical protein [Actinocorallia longicatena]|uniref:VWFA domain-containing protein n=1 Tax=Actinocorallia longicatena TaxID=111803 RepID=A0ABP6Q5J9_9ACTN